MSRIRLEFEELEILRPKKRWKLYFIVVAEHPEDPDKMVVTTLPEPIIQLKPRQENKIYFEPQNSVGADGFFILEREMPLDRSVKVSVYLRHSRQAIRGAADILSDLENELGTDAIGIVENILGSSAPWLVVTKSAGKILAKTLKKVKDRDLGFVCMDEAFGDEFEEEEELDRVNNFSTGDAKIVWSWSVQD